jgi:hypothetical protein
MRRVIQVEKLPKEQSREDLIITHGYAVGLRMPWTAQSTCGDDKHWFFFNDLPPAWVFIRSARMGDPMEGNIFVAANEVRFKEHVGHDVRTLFITEPASYGSGPEITAIWVQGLDEKSKFWPSSYASKEELKALTKRLEGLN